MNKKINDEIDLTDLILIIWKKKLSLILITISTIVLVFFTNQFKLPSTIEATTEIEPISVYNETKFKIFNLLLNSRVDMFFQYENPYEKFDSEIKHEKNKPYDDFLRQENNNRNVIINKLNRELLLELFIDTLKDKNLMKNFLNEFQFLEKDNYPSDKEYNKALDELEAAIDIQLIKDARTNILNKYQIKLRYSNLKMDKWKDFLEFLEKKINNEVQKKLLILFEDYFAYLKNIKEFEIFSITNQFKYTLDDSIRLNLENRKNFLLSDESLDQLELIFTNSPFMQKDNFLSGRIIHNETAYSDQKKMSDLKTYIVAAILGLIISIFYIVIANSIQNRK